MAASPIARGGWIAIKIVDAGHFAAVARIVGISAYRVLTICRRCVALALETADSSNVRALAIDETPHARSHVCITPAADALGRRMLTVVEGREAKTVTAIATVLDAHGCPPESIESVRIDMLPASSRAAPKRCPTRATGQAWIGPDSCAPAAISACAPAADRAGRAGRRR